MSRITVNDLEVRLAARTNLQAAEQALPNSRARAGGRVFAPNGVGSPGAGGF